MMSKDWTGNKKSTFATLGASSHAEGEREVNDYYATDPAVIKPLMDIIGIKVKGSRVWECACGEGHLSKELLKYDFEKVYSSDLVNRGYGESGLDFLKMNTIFQGNIITNPPYKYAEEFVRKGISLVPKGNLVCMFLKITFLEGQKRRALFEEFPPKYVAVFSSRQKCAKNGDFENTGSSAACYAWFIWEKGFKGETKIKWI